MNGVPTVAVPGPLLLIAKSGVGEAFTVVLTGGLVLLPGELSPPPLTTAVLPTEPACVGVTLMVATRTPEAPLAMTVLEVHVTVCATMPQVKPALPLALLMVSPAARVSLTVMVPLVGPVPTLARVSR